MGCKLLIEAPVNGGRNYNGPKVAKFSSWIPASRPKSLPISLLLTLPLLVARVRANHAHDALAADDAALFAPLGD